MRRALLLLTIVLTVAASLSADEAQLASDYHRALTAYRRGDRGAIALLTAIVEKDEQDPATLKARYFLARALIRDRQWREASAHIITIYAISPAFYKEWSCDHLLGETRKALGEN